GVDISLLLRRIHTSWREGDLHRRRSTAAQPPRTIKSASETFLPPRAEPLKSFRIASSFCSTVVSCAGSLTSQSFCGTRRMRAPLAPPRLSEPRNVDAEAQAVETIWDTDRREARIFAFSAWTVAVRFNSHNRNSNDPVGTSHSCQYRKSPATHPGPGAS